MIKKRYLVALSALSAGIAACSGNITDHNSTGSGSAGASMSASGGGPGTGGAGPATGGAGPGTGGTAGSGTGGAGPATGGAGPATGGTGGAGPATGGSAGIPNGGTTCVPGVPPGSQIPRMTNAQYDNVVRDLLGVTAIQGLNNVPASEVLVADSDGSLTDIAWNAYLTVADKIASEVMAGPNKSKFIACDPAAAGCLTQTIRDFGRKAFRRPLTEAEVTSFSRLDALTPKGTPNEVAEGILYAMLASPSFIMIPELAQDMEAGALKLSSYEVAARLSFLLWGSVPDDALNMAANMNQLATKADILTQAQRMVLVREKTGPVVAAFHRMYADIRLGSHWDGITHDATKYPKYSEAIRAPMMQEIDKFFEDVAFNNGTFKDLFLSNVAYVNKDTAPIYDLPNPAQYGTELTRVTLDATQRPGFLTRVGFLSSFSAGASTSPILRGAYIAKNIIGIHIEDPPPEASKTPVPPGNYMTQRQVMEALTAGPTCQGCHAGPINPAGFVLEKYDSIGGWQTIDPLGGMIDGTANVEFNSGAKTITSPVELMTELATGPDAKRRYAEKWVTFGTRRVPNPQDACTVDGIDLKLSTDGYTILNVLADLTQADAFRLRSVEP